jgi:hypothetical protein
MAKRISEEMKSSCSGATSVYQSASNEIKEANAALIVNPNNSGQLSGVNAA